MKLIMENWRRFVKEAASDEEIEKHITSTDDADKDGKPDGVLPLEGGAAGLKAIKAYVKKELGAELPDDFDFEEFLKGLENVGKHTEGDYIQDDGKQIKVTKENLDDIVEGVDIFLEAQDEILGEKKRRKKRKKKKKKKGKKDACYHKVRARYDVWPSAYASGALVKCRKVGASNWGNKSKKKKKRRKK
jgi:hypothetical protein